MGREQFLVQTVMELVHTLHMESKSYVRLVEGREELYAELVSVSMETILMISKTLEESWIECQTKHRRFSESIERRGLFHPK